MTCTIDTSEQYGPKSSVKIFTDFEALKFLSDFQLHWKPLNDTPLKVTYDDVGIGVVVDDGEGVSDEGRWVLFHRAKCGSMQMSFSKDMWLSIVTKPSELKDFAMREVFIGS